VHCAEVVLEQASKKKPVFIASTSEAHGKSHDIPYHEDGDLTPWLHAPGRWSYACSSVHGDGTERRCFCHVGDVVRAIADLMHREDVYGEVLVGADEEITILELARKVKEATASASETTHVPYDEGYEEGFEDWLGGCLTSRRFGRRWDGSRRSRSRRSSPT
jgi:UDP-glucose 4-epimerase